jgi:hypothetical protein
MNRDIKPGSVYRHKLHNLAIPAFVLKSVDYFSTTFLQVPERGINLHISTLTIELANMCISATRTCYGGPSMSYNGDLPNSIFKV